MKKGMRSLLRRIKTALPQVFHRRYESEEQLKKDASEIMKDIEQYAANECKDLSKCADAIAKRHELDLANNINNAFAAMKAQVADLLRIEDSDIEISLPEFTVARRLDEGIEKENYTQEQIRRHERTEPRKFLWLIPIPFTEKKVVVTTKVYSLDVDRMERQLRKQIEQWVDHACCDFNRRATEEAGSYRQMIESKLRLYRDSFTQEAERNWDEAKKQKWVSDLKRLDALRNEIFTTADVVLKGVPQASSSL